jgi:hypothetical protein
VDAVAKKESIELKRRERLYRGDTPEPDATGKTILLVDDGIATGSTMRAAVAALRQQGPSRIIVAVPVAPPATCKELQTEADEVVTVMASRISMPSDNGMRFLTRRPTGGPRAIQTVKAQTLDESRTVRKRSQKAADQGFVKTVKSRGCKAASGVPLRSPLVFIVQGVSG